MLDLYRELVRDQQIKYGEGYISHHFFLSKYGSLCESIKELGVYEGCSLACLMLTNPKKLVGIDRDISRIKNVEKFKNYAIENNIDFDIKNLDSLDIKAVSSCDLLHIDSFHTYEYLLNELRLHGPYIRKYIIFHDTNTNKRVLTNSQGLLQAIAYYISEIEPKWQIVEHSLQGMGSVVIKREI